MNEDAFLHFPTTLDWIEHLGAFYGFIMIGWWLRGVKTKRALHERTSQK